MQNDGSPTFCILPWSHVFFYPNGKILTCCEGSEEIGEAKEGLVEHLNSAKMQEIRRSILNNQWHSNCLKCRKKEEAGFKSSRVVANHYYKDNATQLIGPITPNPILVDPKLYKIEFRLNNLCNFKCRTCDLNSSSSWFEDEIALYQAGLLDREPKKKIIESEANMEKILPLLTTVKKIEFSGGEPFLDSRVLTLLEEIIKLNRQNEIFISFITNLSHFQIDNKITQILSKFKFKHFLISIDAYGERAEYIRSGTRWPKIQENLEYFLEDFGDRSYYEIHCTFSLFNAWHLIDFHHWAVHNMEIPLDNFVMNLALGPDHISAKNLPHEIRKDLIKAYQNYQEGWAKMPRNALFSSFQGPVKFLSSEPTPDDQRWLKVFFDHVDLLDRRRNEKFETVFPEWQDLRNFL